MIMSCYSCFFFFNLTATTEIYTYLHTLSLHDALPISLPSDAMLVLPVWGCLGLLIYFLYGYRKSHRSEEHTSELQSLMRTSYAVFCLKKKTTIEDIHIPTFGNLATDTTQQGIEI